MRSLERERWKEPEKEGKREKEEYRKRKIETETFRTFLNLCLISFCTILPSPTAL